MQEKNKTYIYLLINPPDVCRNLLKCRCAVKTSNVMSFLTSRLISQTADRATLRKNISEV